MAGMETYSSGFAQVYDAIYTRMKNYENEARQVEAWIRSRHPTARTLLDVACGTGEHAKYLKANFHVDGLDLSEEFVEVARRKNPECEYFCGDMSKFRLNKSYDVVMSLFSSIGYVRTEARLRQTIANLGAHLAPGGIVIVEPWLKPEDWKVGAPRMFTVDEPDFKVCRMNTTSLREGHSCMDFHFLVGTGDGVRHFHEEHVLGLFTVEQMTEAFRSCGLAVEHDPKGLFGRGLYIGKKI